MLMIWDICNNSNVQYHNCIRAYVFIIIEMILFVFGVISSFILYKHFNKFNFQMLSLIINCFLGFFLFLFNLIIVNYNVKSLTIVMQTYCYIIITYCLCILLINMRYQDIDQIQKVRLIIKVVLILLTISAIVFIFMFLFHIQIQCKDRYNSYFFIFIGLQVTEFLCAYWVRVQLKKKLIFIEKDEEQNYIIFKITITQILLLLFTIASNIFIKLFVFVLIKGGYFKVECTQLKQESFQILTGKLPRDQFIMVMNEISQLIIVLMIPIILYIYPFTKARINRKIIIHKQDEQLYIQNEVSQRIYKKLISQI